MRTNHNNVTVPAMPAALKKIHRPTLIFKMPIEVQQEQEQQRKPGRYSIVVPRNKEA
jgi:hypothetical protein